MISPNINEKALVGKFKKISHVTAYPPMMYLAALLVGLLLELLIPIRVIPGFISNYVGIPLLLLAPLIILSAQKSSRAFNKNTTEESMLDIGNMFHKGIYKYTRNPTYLGLFLLLLGFGLMANLFFVVVTTVIAFIITHAVFLKHEEKILEHKYGELYTEYKKKVRSWI